MGLGGASAFEQRAGPGRPFPIAARALMPMHPPSTCVKVPAHAAEK